VALFSSASCVSRVGVFCHPVACACIDTVLHTFKCVVRFISRHSGLELSWLGWWSVLVLSRLCNCSDELGAYSMVWFRMIV
jgi:hypothetical protein